MPQDKNKSQNSESPNYEWWVDFKSIWELSEAANLYLGFTPQKGGTFYQFNEFLKKYDRGLILTDSETVWDVKTLKKADNFEWEDVFYDDQNIDFNLTKSRTSLKDFMREKIAANKIKSISYDDTNNLYFEPVEIVKFFQQAFLNEPPLELLISLKLRKEDKQPDFLLVKECYHRHGKEIIQHLKTQFGRKPKKIEIAAYIKEKYLPNVSIGTILKNFQPSRDLI